MSSPTRARSMAAYLWRDRSLPSRERLRRLYERPRRPQPTDSPYYRRLWHTLFEDDRPIGQIVAERSSLEEEKEPMASSSSSRKPRKPAPRLDPYNVLELTDPMGDLRLNLLDWRDEDDLAVALQDHVVLVSSARNSKRVKVSDLLSVAYCDGPVTSVSWGVGGRVAVGLATGNVQLWEMHPSSTSRLLRTFRGARGHPVCSLSWNGKILTAGAMDGRIRSYDVAAQGARPVLLYKGHTKEVCGLRWSDLPCSTGSRTLASGGFDGLVNIWDVRTSRSYHSFDHGPSMAKALAWSPLHEDLLAFAGGEMGNNSVCFYNVKTGKLLNSVDVDSTVYGLAWSPDGEELLSCGRKLTIRDYPSMDTVREFEGSGSEIISVSQNNAGTGLRFGILAATEKQLVLWDVFGSHHLAKMSYPFSGSIYSTIRNMK